MLDPFEEVDPAEDIDPWQVLTTQLSRSMLWDMIGPDRMRDESLKFGHAPASPDVLEAEGKEMWERKYALVPFGWDFPLLCFIASEAASAALINSDEKLRAMSEEDIYKFRVNNVRLVTAATESVVGHMIQNGLIKYGDFHDIVVGKQDPGTEQPDSGSSPIP